MPYKYPHPPNLNPHPEPHPDPNIRLNARPRPRLNALSPTGPGPGFTHIPQPPHSAGLGLQGLRPRIDPSQVPSAVESVEGDREHWGGRGVYTTLPEVGKKPPLASTSEVEFVDQGNSTPNYIRLTTWSFPSTSKLANECGMPLGAIVQPFSDGVDVPGVRFEDSNSYSSHASSSGPPRCSRCRAYINPWCTFTHLKFKCNLCEAETDVPEWYASPLDGQGVRLDAGRREELCRGTIDLILDQAGEEYWGATSRPPKPQRCIFAFDVSAPTFFYAACVALINTLYGDGDGDRGWNGSELAIITYDSTVHLWVWAPDQDTYTTNAHGNANAPRLLVMPDIDEPFIPVPTDALFIDPYSTSGREAVRALLESLPQRFPSPHTGTALGSLLTTAQSMLHDRGGHVVVFLGAIPSVGLGALPARPVNESEDKEKLAYRPRTPFYPNLASECAEQGIGVSLFLGNDEWVDVASVGTLPTLTGGSLFFHPRFNLARDGPVMESQLRRIISDETMYDCVVKVRCSRGLKIASLNGPFTLTSPSFTISRSWSESGTMAFGVMDPDKAFCVELGIGGGLTPLSYGYIQVAVLYTTPKGVRKVRLINLAFPIVELAGNVFSAADVEACVCFLGRKAVLSLPKTKPSLIRDDLTENCSAILLGYRNLCASANRVTQLIIPDTMKALPTYTLALMKSKPLKARPVSSDVRNYHIHRLLSMGVRETMLYLYPRLWAVHDLDLEPLEQEEPSLGSTPTLVGKEGEDLTQPLTLEGLHLNDNGEPEAAPPAPASGSGVHKLPKQRLPPIMRLTHEWMEARGMYLIDNGESTILWIGSEVEEGLVREVFGSGEELMGLDPGMPTLPLPSSSLKFISHSLHLILHTQSLLRGGRKSRFFIARQNLDAAELEFSDMLVEDENCGTVGYLDYLAIIHKQISAVLTEGGSLGGGSGLRSPW